MGYIRIDRRILEWEWYSDANTSRLFIHLLLKANWKPGRFQGIEVPVGSLVTSYNSLAAETGLSVRNIRTALSHLQSTGEVTCKCHSKYSVISIKNYTLYQLGDTVTDTQVTSNRHASDKQVTTIEYREEDKQLINNNIVGHGATEYQYKDVIDYLNLKTGKAFKDKSKDSRKFIKARFDEGYTLDDFKTVIDKKTAEWKDTEMNTYLRPATLFGNKFESYLNQSKGQKKKSGFTNFDQREYDYSSLEGELLGRG